MIPLVQMVGVGTNNRLPPAVFSDDVFSTDVYNGASGSLSVVNNIDLSTNGGLVWIKNRLNLTVSHAVFDTVRGATHLLSSDSAALDTVVAASLTAFNTTGFTVSTDSRVKSTSTSTTYGAWTFRCAPRFFDVQTFTAGTSTNRRIAHNLGMVPGMVIIKNTTGSAGGWWVQHIGAVSTAWYRTVMTLNSQAVPNALGLAANTAPTVSDFGIDETQILSSGSQYVVYFFAHDPNPDGIIQCGTYTTDVSGNATVPIGWEPQYVLDKCITATGNWSIVDSIRGLELTGNNSVLLANSNVNEDTTTGKLYSPAATSASNLTTASATGINAVGRSASSTYVYVAVRRSNKPPTSGAQVYFPSLLSGSSSDVTISTPFAPDLVINQRRANATNPPRWTDRLRGVGQSLNSTLGTNGQSNDLTSGVSTLATTNIIVQGNSADYNTSGGTYVYHILKRAVGVFDIATYNPLSNSTAGIVPHSLGVPPELIIIRNYTNPGSITANWIVGYSAIGFATNLFLNTTAIPVAGGYIAGSPTSTTFTFTSAGNPAGTKADNFVAYLFATRAGVSKVNTYNGNGGSQTINCGFSTGARFILIKNLSATGNWYVWDSARGIVTGSDPHLALNVQGIEVSDDSVDPDPSGFIVNQVAATNINLSGDTYLFFSLA